MRSAFVKTLVEIAKQDSRIILLTGDLGYRAIEPYRDSHPDRFFNVGVAEQNMIGVATGLAECGYIPFTYSIVPFAVLRPYEFIRNGPLLHRLPVRIIGVGGGVEYGPNGATHYGLEDFAVMRIWPGMTIIAPVDYAQARTALLETWNLPGPVYYRVGKDDQSLVQGLDGRFQLGRLQMLVPGTDLLLLATGAIASEAIKAGEILKGKSVSCAIAVTASLSPPPVEDIVSALSHFAIVMTVEAQYVAGGLGSLVAEIIAEKGLRCRLVRCGVKVLPDGITGSQAYMQRRYGLSPEQLAQDAQEALCLSKT